MARTGFREKPKEKHVLAYLVEFLEKFHVQYSRNVHVRLIAKKEGARTIYQPVKLRESQKGKPDLFVFLPGLRKMPAEITGPTTAMIETKSKDGELSPDQLRWRDNAVANGFDYFAVFDFKQADKVIDWITAQWKVNKQHLNWAENPFRSASNRW